MAIDYKINAPVTTDQFIELLNTSGLGERRPVDDRACMEGMLENADPRLTSPWVASGTWRNGAAEG
ncbi:MAG TPA: hypothetical protein VLT88_09090, partial [Desulfosarcina sp.]|nr:hypothetical protein [Desulfosarcina sp.]